ncbi:protein kinase domain-containing protein [Micromonospora sp. DT43]|uniref:serine/threonine-protein kinase n=1 Tax=Micromonospora sp. DT43 TaxID=3393440 RepID=UPI003CED6392
MPDSQPGQRLVAGRYRLETVLGQGGMGVVWRATDELIGRVVAVKEVRAPLGLAGEERRLFGERALREARTAGRINHPAVVAIYDLVPARGDDEAVYIVTELVDAPTLADLLDREGPLPPARVTAIAVRMLDALKAAHSVGVVHRDVKPGNIMVLPGGGVKLLDFGIAQAAGDARLTRHGMMGSTGYLAPELFHGSDPTPAADLWSAGVTLAQAVSGELPFERGSTAATLHAILYDDIPAVRCGEPLTTVITGLLTRDVAQRLTVEKARDLLDVPLGASATGRPDVAAAHEQHSGDGDAAPVGDSWERRATTLHSDRSAPPRQRKSAPGPRTSATTAPAMSLQVVLPAGLRKTNTKGRLAMLGLFIWATAVCLPVALAPGAPSWLELPYLGMMVALLLGALPTVIEPWSGTLRLDARSLRMAGARGKPAVMQWKQIASITVGPADEQSSDRSRLGIGYPTGTRFTSLARRWTAGLREEHEEGGPMWIVGDIGISPAKLVERLRAVVPDQVEIVGPVPEMAEWSARYFQPFGPRRHLAVPWGAVMVALILGGHIYLIVRP